MLNKVEKYVPLITTYSLAGEIRDRLTTYSLAGEFFFELMKLNVLRLVDCEIVKRLRKHDQRNCGIWLKLSMIH